MWLEPVFWLETPIPGGPTPRHFLRQRVDTPQIAHLNQIVSCKRHQRLEIQIRLAHKPTRAHAADGLRPAKAFLDPRPDSLADHITFVAGGASIDRR